jgi:phenylacetate-CoA ligase
VSPGREVRRAGCRLLLGRTFRQAAAVSERTEWLSGSAIREQQWRGVVALVEAAQTAGACRDRRLSALESRGLTRTRFAEIPPMTRDDLRHAASGRTIGRSSGGSGGESVTVPIDRGVYAWYMTGTWRGFSWWGVDIAQPVILLLGRTARSALQGVLGAVKDWAVGWRRFPVDGRFDRRVPEILDGVRAADPVALYGYPSAVDRLACEQQRRGSPVRRRRLKVIVLTGEPVYEFQRRRIEETFQCPVAEEYGMGELGSVGFECPDRRLHVSAETVFLEIMPDVMSNGAQGAGRIVATHLRNRLLPLIRYDTGDIGAMPPEPCPCGRGLPVLRIYGRAADCLLGPDGPVLAHPVLDRVFAALPPAVQGYARAAQASPGLMRLDVAPDAVDAAGGTGPIAAAAADALGPAWAVAVEPRPLARVPSGKLPLFVRS